MLGGLLHLIPNKGLYYFLVTFFFFFFLRKKERFEHQPLGEFTVSQFAEGETARVSYLF